MKKIESYINENLDLPAKKRIEKKVNANKSIEKKMLLYKYIDLFMKGALMAADAEMEMILKRIDTVAAGFVIDYFKQINNKDSKKEYLSWS